MRWEIARYFSTEKEAINFDYSILAQARDGTSSEILLAAARKEKVDEFCRILCRAGINLILVDVDALALQNLYLHAYGSKDTIVEVLLDIGAATTKVNVLRGESLFFSRSLSVGGYRYLEVLQDRLGLSAEEAQRTLYLHDLSAGLLARIKPLLDLVSRNLALEVDQTLSYVRTTLHVPRIEHRVDRADQLLPRVLGKFLARLFAEERLEIAAQLAQVISGQFRVVPRANALLHSR